MVAVQRIYVWPLADELEQIKIFMEQVVPIIERNVET
jgi:hypothetical protein